MKAHVFTLELPLTAIHEQCHTHQWIEESSNKYIKQGSILSILHCEKFRAKPHKPGPNDSILILSSLNSSRHSGRSP